MAYFTNGVETNVQPLNGSERLPADFGDGSSKALTVAQIQTLVGGKQNQTNGLIGVDFGSNLWQRGSSFSAIASTLTYTADRWWAVGSVDSNIEVSKVAGPSGWENSARVQRASGNTSVTLVRFGQVLTTVNSLIFAGQKVEVRLVLTKGTDWSGQQLNVVLGTGTGNDQSAVSFAAGTWDGFSTQTDEVTVEGQNSVFFDIPAGVTQLGLSLEWIPSGTAGVNDWIELAGIQLVCNNTGAPGIDVRRLAEDEIEEQLQYYWQQNEGVGFGFPGYLIGSNSEKSFVRFPTRMRIVPTLTVASGGWVWDFGSTTVPIGALTFAGDQFGGVLSDSVVATSGVSALLLENTLPAAGTASMLVGTGTSGKLVFDAEL